MRPCFVTSRGQRPTRRRPRGTADASPRPGAAATPAGCRRRGPWGVRTQLVTLPTRTHGSVHRGSRDDAAEEAPAHSLGDHAPTVWACQAEAAVRAVLIVVLDVTAQDVHKVLAADDQEVVKARSADGPDPAFGDGVGVGRPNRRADDLGTGRAPDIVECSGELGVSVADQEPDCGGTVAEVQEKAAGLLGHPWAARWAVTPPSARAGCRARSRT
jgi:hypothetical protein